MPELSRREFMFLGMAAGATVAIGIVLPVVLTARDEEETPTGPSSTTPAALVALFPRVKVAKLSALQVGEPVMFDYPLQGQANIVVKLGNATPGGVGLDGDIVSFSRICTHMGCVLEDFQAEHAVLGPCPCHFSTFDLAHNGMVTLGQATQNLPQVLLDIEGDDVYATGVLRLVYGFHNTLQGASPVEVST